MLVAVQRHTRFANPFRLPLMRRRPVLCREIVLWLVAADADLEAECRALHEGESPPYWAFCWGAGQALARWLLDHPAETAGHRVVDFGAGSGVAGIAAARAGARSVVAVDVDPRARAAALENAEMNDVHLEASSSVPTSWDLLLACDVLYEPGLRAQIEALSKKAARIGAGVLVAEPERPGNEGYASEPIARYEVRTLPDVDSPTTAARIYRLA
jgi:predicted nicotinamide N-methyase